MNRNSHAERERLKIQHLIGEPERGTVQNRATDDDFVRHTGIDGRRGQGEPIF